MSTLRDSIDRFVAGWAIRAVLVLRLSAWWLARKIQHGTHPRIEAVPAEELGMSCSHRQTCKSVGRLREFVRASKVFVAPGSCSRACCIARRWLLRGISTGPGAGKVRYQRCVLAVECTSTSGRHPIR